MRKQTIIIGLIILAMTACTIKPQPIAYGTDGCHFCSMTIVDQQHAAQIVTKKGKVFKFDASECMLNHLKEVDTSEIALFLVNDYKAPGKLIDATNATYLISEDIPSPMGEFLTAFSSKDAAESVIEEKQHSIFTWIELQERFNNK